MAELTHSASRRVYRRRRRRWPLVLATLLTLAVAAAGATLGIRLLLARGETMPGVRVFGVDVGGLDRVGAAHRISAAGAAVLHRPLTVLAGGRSFTLRPDRVLRVDAVATADRALATARGLGDEARALLSPVPPARDVKPVLEIQRRAAGAYLAELRRLGTPPVNPRVVLRGASVAIVAGRAGTLPQGNRLLAAIENQVLAGGHVVRLYFRPRAPAISAQAAAAAAAQARAILAGPVTLRHDGRTIGTLAAGRLARFVRIHPGVSLISVSLDSNGLGRAVAPLLARFARKPVSARVVVENDAVHVVPSRAGYAPDPRAAGVAVAAAAAAGGSRVADLPLATVQPDLTTGEARALGIEKPVATFTTDMGTSSANRIWNVHLMARYIDGTLIKPGDTFSFNRVVGPRTAERGFREGQEIVGSLLIPSIGGGVCQTATTLFNDAFELGLPILARQNHSFYISHYPMGRDATVSWGGPDLVFRNDLKTGLVIKASYTDSTLTFTFWGTPSGRRVVAETGPQHDVTEPHMTYVVDESAPPHSKRVVPGSGEKGFTVTVFRTVYQGSKVLRRDEFTSVYTPGNPTTVYGTEAHAPRPYIVVSSTT